ncbi:MAG: GTP-binding protein [Armatimonas sp.]
MTPRALTVTKPTRLILVGGFLGAGKTTALQALAQSLLDSGLSVGFVTNDQATDLVDTRTLGRLQLPIAEVAGGCFCCKFDDLIASAEQVLQTGPDVLLCEPVGSCTDMAATVLAPLRRYYPDAFLLSPFTVLVEPERYAEMASLPESVRYIFEKQLEEADIIAANKIDTLSEDATIDLLQALATRYGKPTIPFSAHQGHGIDEWRSLLLRESAEIDSLSEIDYDLYAEGEAVLGWLNATARLSGFVKPEPFLTALMEQLQRACQMESAAIAHLKASLSGSDGFARANLTQTHGTIALETSDAVLSGETTLVVNARIAMAPERLRQLVEEAIEQTATSAGIRAELLTMQSFRPGYPTPPYRITA